MFPVPPERIWNSEFEPVVIFPGIFALRRDHPVGVMLEMRNVSPQCSRDLSQVNAVGVSVVEALYSLRSWVDNFHSYDHCSSDADWIDAPADDVI
jgi:hypothetical protein